MPKDLIEPRLINSVGVLTFLTAVFFGFAQRAIPPTGRETPPPESLGWFITMIVVCSVLQLSGTVWLVSEFSQVAAHSGRRLSLGAVAVTLAFSAVYVLAMALVYPLLFIGR